MPEHIIYDMDRDLAHVSAMAEGIVILFRPYVEVVLHDLDAGRIVEVWNPISGRGPGDESLIEPGFASEVPHDQRVVGPYEQVDVRGHRTSSVSVRLAGARPMLLCLNVDRSRLEDAVEVLRSFAAPVVDRPAALFSNDWRARINDVVTAWCTSRNRVARDLDRSARVELVRHLEQEGVFAMRHAPEHVAAVLGVSRASVYNLRKAGLS